MLRVGSFRQGFEPSGTGSVVVAVMFPQQGISLPVSAAAVHDPSVELYELG